MASFFKFNSFVEHLAEGSHNLGSNTLKLYLSNTAPDAANDSYKTDVAEITNENGYTAPVTVTITGSSQTGGTYSLVGSDLSPMVTASGGTVGAFRYVVLYNDTMTTPSDDGLIGSWDYGSSITLQDGETFDVDFGASILTIA